MAAASASPRAQRSAILSSRQRELDGFRLAVDCRSADCRGERIYRVAELAASFGPDTTVADVLRRMRCAQGCGGRVLAAWLETGPVLNAHVRPRRVPLLGPDARD